MLTTILSMQHFYVPVNGNVKKSHWKELARNRKIRYDIKDKTAILEGEVSTGAKSDKHRKSGF